MEENNVLLAQNKLIILYLLESIQLPFSVARLQEFAIDTVHMDYFQLSKYIAELIDSNYIDKLQENNLSYYAITAEGSKALALLKDLIPSGVRENIDEYVGTNRKKVESELDVTADFYSSSNNDYIVRCKMAEGSHIIMEINLSVSDKRFANTICNNWKLNVSSIYNKILSTLCDDSGHSNSSADNDSD
ncbi:MAG: DUF4364 family protein [Firmicutes bacterium]|nr:DUF4364 family protein [Bacillota bacterium]